MKIERLYINNFKSLVDFELVKPNPFSVFVGPNGVGKSNIFEALELAFHISKYLSVEMDSLQAPNYSVQRMQGQDITSAFGGWDNVFTVNPKLFEMYEGDSILPSIEHLNSAEEIYFYFDFSDNTITKLNLLKSVINISNIPLQESAKSIKYESFSRLFIKNGELVKIRNIGSEKLSLDASNLEKVLKRLLDNEEKREEIIEWLQLLLPEFSNIEVRTEELSGMSHLLIYEKHSKKPFNKNLISDGTYNILALLTAVFQSDEPQFLCIEEPENGLNPKAIKALVSLFRDACEEKGHYIWLNTHSQSLVNELEAHELIVVDKKEGITVAKQISQADTSDLELDEAWLTGTFQGGLPW
jgi:predicted ATPase